MAAALPDTISLNLADWEQTISFRTSAEPILNLEIFDTLAKATAQRQQLQLTYRKPGRRETELRLVDPYHLANINGEWFLFAWCHLRQDIRTFVPARIQAIETHRQDLRPPAKIFPGKTAARQFRRAIRPGTVSTSSSASTNWSATTSGKRNGTTRSNCSELKDGGVELRMKLSSLAEVERWVLGWAGNAKVIQPPELAEKVRKSAQDILERQKVRKARYG